MSGNVAKWVWTTEKRRAAIRLADGRMSDEEVAAEAGISDRQLLRWRKNPTFLAKIQSIVEREAAAIEDLSIADKRQRMLVLQDLLDRQLGIIAERAIEGAELAKKQAKNPYLGGDILNSIGKKRYHAGARSGLIAVASKQMGTLVSEEAAADTGLVKSILSTMEQAAKESDQWETRVNVKHTGKVTHDHRHFDLSNLSNDELAQLELLAEKIEAGTVAG